MKRILLTIALIYLLLFIISILTQGNIALPFMALLGATIGIPMAITYPFSFGIKLCLVSGLIIAFLAISYGITKRHLITGQLLVIAGMIGWSFIGLIGLGTGT